MLKNRKTPFIILSTMIIGILLFVSVGLSIWLITDKVEIKPEFNTGIIVEYLDSKETKYNGNIQLPSANALNIDNDILNYYYKLVEYDVNGNIVSGENDPYKIVDRDNSDGTLEGPQNAGDFLLKVEYIQYSYKDESGNIVNETVEIENIKFKISPESVKNLNIFFENNENAKFYYNGSEIEAIKNTLKVQFNGKDLTLDTDYFVEFSDLININSGEKHVATITGIGNFNEVVELEYSIVPTALKIVISNDAVITNVPGRGDYYTFEFGKYNDDNFPLQNWITVQTSNNDAVDATISYKYYSGFSGTYDTTLDLSSQILNFGYYGFQITAHSSDANFSDVTIEMNIFISQLNIQNATVTISESPIFNGLEQKPSIDSIVCGVTNIELSELQAGDITYSENILAGNETGKVNIKGSGNYIGTAVGNFTIQTRPAYMSDGTTLNYTITTPTSISKTNFIEGVDISAYCSPAGTASINGFTLSGKMKVVSPTFTDGANATQSVTLSFEFLSAVNKNGVKNVESATVSSALSVTLYGIAYNSSKNIYYGTVERSMDTATSGNCVWIVPNIYSLTGFYPTIRSNTEVPSGVTLGLSYNGEITGTDYTAAYINKQESATNSSNKVYLEIAQDKKVINNGTIVVGSCVYSSGSWVSSATVIMNNGTIENKSGSEFYAFGYVKGTGEVISKPDSTVYELFIIYDWPGGTNAKSISGESVFPFQTFGFTNISCSLKIEKDSALKTWCQINASSSWIMADYITVCGNGGLFQLKGDTSDYILMGVEHTTGTSDFNGSYTVPNFDRTLRTVLNVYGNFKDNSVTVSIASSYKISTSTSLAMPLGFININIMRGKGELTVNSYKFLPGSRLQIAAGAEVEIGSNVHALFYDEAFKETYTYVNSGTVLADVSYYYQNNHTEWYNKYKDMDELGAQLIINGTCTVNGYIGGKIRTESTTGVLKLSHDNASIKVLSSLTYEGGVSGLLGGAGATTRSDTKTPSAKLYTASGITNSFRGISAGTYYSKQDSKGNYGWYTNSIDISYNLNGGSGTLPASKENITIDENGYTVLATDVPSITLTREHYTFVGWAYDLNGNELAKAGDVLYASTTLYAAWRAVPYYISYKNVYNTASDNVGETGFNSNPNVNTTDGTGRTEYNVANAHTISFKTPELLDSNGEKLVFGGWYTDVSCAEEYRVYSAEGFTGNVILYAYWYPASTTTIEVIYHVEQEETVTTIPAGLISSSEIVPIIGKTITFTPTNIAGIINNETDIDGYFGGWYFEETYQNSFVADYETIMGGENTQGKVVDGRLHLYGKILKKATITIDFNEGTSSGGLKEGTYYYAVGATISLPTVTRTEYQFTNWTADTSGVTISGNSVSVTTNSVTTITANYLKKYVLDIKNTSGYSAEVTVYINSVAQTQVTIKNNASNTWNVLEGDSVKIYVKVTYKEWFQTKTKEGYINGANEETPHIVGANGNSFEINEESGGCITTGSLITLYDGSQKKVEDLTKDDLLLVWNHEIGKFDYAPAVFLIHKGEKEQLHRVITLKFSNGKEVKIVSEHGFFDIDLRKYVYINENNVIEFIGHRFANTDNLDVINEIKLIDYSITEEITRIYSPITYKHLNCFVDGILTVTNFTEGLVNYFELDENLKYDEAKMQADIEKYGLYTPEDWEGYLTYEEFMAFNGTYVKVAVGKGHTTIEDIIDRIKRFVTESNGL